MFIGNNNSGSKLRVGALVRTYSVSSDPRLHRSGEERQQHRGDRYTLSGSVTFASQVLQTAPGRSNLRITILMRRCGLKRDFLSRTLTDTPSDNLTERLQSENSCNETETRTRKISKWFLILHQLLNLPSPRQPVGSNSAPPNPQVPFALPCSAAITHKSVSSRGLSRGSGRSLLCSSQSKR